VLGANVVKQCLYADLVAEILLVVLPIVLGDGIRLFGRSNHWEMTFEPLSATRAGQAVILRFRRRR
jgi:dihydrofolate reductase